MEPHGLSPWYLPQEYPPTPLGAEALRCAGAKASEGKLVIELLVIRLLSH